MTKLKQVLFILMLIAGAKAGPAQTRVGLKQIDSEYSSSERPWVWWFWLGNIVTESSIEQQLQSFQKSGFGGVTIISTYGVKGFEKAEIPFRTARWFQMIAHTIKKAKALGMGVDLALSSAWPYGGPSVTTETAAKMLKGIESFHAAGVSLSRQLTTNGGKQNVVAVSAFSKKDQYLDLSSSVSEAGLLKTDLPQGDWDIHVLYSVNTMQKVKRSAPGGEGLVLDHFDAASTKSYLDGFDSSLHYLQGIRSAFNDSYEVYSADFTSGFLKEFEKRRGYSLKPWFTVLFDSAKSELKERILCDYRETIADLLLDGFVDTWTQWNHRHGFLVTEQAHGSPGNLLDLYGMADIPQTESFGPSHFSIPGVRTDPDIRRDRYKWPDKLMFKFASSSAHIIGRKLVSAETATWLTNHFKMSLSQVKPQIDELFIAGINHIMLISATNTPSSVPFPGWVFYPAPDFGPHAPFYDYLPNFSNYISRAQHLLQNSKSDNDILVYFPIYDYWSEAENDLGILPIFDHIPTKWGDRFPFSQTIRSLWKEGFSFDYISDRQIRQLRAGKGDVITQGGSHYKMILVPPCKRISPETMEALARLAELGVRIVFEKEIPANPPGWSNLNDRMALLNRQANRIKDLKNVVLTQHLCTTLSEAGCRQEAFNAMGLQFIRKQYGKGMLYFVANLDSSFSRGRLPLGVDFESVVFMDPLTGKQFAPAIIKEGSRKYIDLELLPGQSCFLFTDLNAAKPVESFPYRDSAKTYVMKADWTISFEKTGFMLPQTIHTRELKSWTDYPDTALQFYSGTAVYSAVVEIPPALQSNKLIRMSIPGLRDMAELYVNGHSAGRSWSAPFTFDIEPGWLKRKNNRINIRVTNLSTNRVIWMDRHKIPWKNFYIADPVKGVFDAADWELQASGIIGEIWLTGTK